LVGEVGKATGRMPTRWSGMPRYWELGCGMNGAYARKPKTKTQDEKDAAKLAYNVSQNVKYADIYAPGAEESRKK
jgi:hypothetical protein